MAPKNVWAPVAFRALGAPEFWLPNSCQGFRGLGFRGSGFRVLGLALSCN